MVDSKDNKQKPVKPRAPRRDGGAANLKFSRKVEGVGKSYLDGSQKRGSSKKAK